MLAERDTERMRDFYRESLLRHPLAPHQQVRWWTENSQRVRFEVLARIGEMAGSSILDVGCGLGDLYGFLRGTVREFEYEGVDILPEFVGQAKLRHPGIDFREGDFMALPEDRTFDYVLASGALSFRIPDHERFYFGMIAKMFRLARRSAGFNMLRQGRHTDDGVHATYDPERVASFCETLSPRPAIEMVTDYFPEDFTVFLHK